jgi:hypothetical protein
LFDEGNIPANTVAETNTALENAGEQASDNERPADAPRAEGCLEIPAGTIGANLGEIATNEVTTPLDTVADADDL